MPHIDTPQARVRLGLGRRDITPPVGIYHRLWGAAKQDQATGVHRSLTATAVVFQAAEGPTTPESEQVLVALDLCILWRREMEAVLSAVCRQAGLAPGQVVCNFNHTHSSGLPGLERVNMPGGDLIPAYLDRLNEAVAAAVAEARAAARPATLAFGTGVCPLATHRDFWDEDSGQFVCGFNPGGSVDKTVLVARATGEDGRPLATLVNYACHPTTLAWDNTLISPDFPGAMREVIERATGAPCVFLQGASGEVGPREGFVGDTAVADRNGRQLGYAALAALEDLPPPGTRFVYTGPVVSGATIGTWDHVRLEDTVRRRHAQWRCRRWEIPLPYRPELPTRATTEADLVRFQAEEEAATRTGDPAKARDCRAMAERRRRFLNILDRLPPGSRFPLPVTLWQTGDALWFAVEAEHYNILQRALRQRFPEAPIMVMTLANGSRVNYLPTADIYGKGIYQESIAILAPGSLETVIDVVGEQMAKWIQER
jgi:hypothetical protein